MAPESGVAGVRTLSGLGPSELRDRHVLVRCDLNVPIDEDGKVGDAMRIRASLPTLRYLLDSGARVVVMSHLGRPKGVRRPEFSLAPVAAVLEAELGQSVTLVENEPGSPEFNTRLSGWTGGGILLLENLRFYPGETENSSEFSNQLARKFEIFVFDAFGTAHRAHASTEGVPGAVRGNGGIAVAGLLVEQELRFMGEALESPERPFVAVMGGAKISGKIDVIEALLPRVDRLLVGGAMANTFFRAMGLDTGRSLVEEDRVEMAAELMESAGDRLVLPVDCRVADELSAEASPRAVDRADVSGRDRIGDMGPRSAELFAREIESASTVVWNGPMGVFESEPFAGGTLSVARSMARVAGAGGTAIVGGGDSAAAVQGAGLSSEMTHVSTGGGASLDLLAGRPLPGLQALDPATGHGTSAPNFEQTLPSGEDG